MKARTRFTPTLGQALRALGQALRVLLCSIFRVEMSMEIDTEEVRRIRKPNVEHEARQQNNRGGQTC